MNDLSDDSDRHALEGIHVLDLSWVIAGPLTTKYFSDHGATVVKVETANRIDLLRTNYPFVGNVYGEERSGLFSNYNTGKFSLALDIKQPKALELIKSLVNWSDVLVENFSPGVMPKYGLSYDDLRRIRPDIIMVSLSMQGQTGPHARQPGYGHLVQALAGFTSITGWPDRPPINIFGAYPDYIGSPYAVIAVLAALENRDQTGEGYYIDVSQLEAGISILAPAVLDNNVNHRLLGGQGNRCPYAAPHGVYKCQGVERWCVIAVFSDDHWDNFSRACGNPDWAGDPRFATLLERKAHEDELDSLVEEWTRRLSPEDVVARLQRAGVPAGIVRNGKDICEDPQLQSRGYFWPLDYPGVGMNIHNGHPFRLSDTPADLRRAPRLGEHTEYVCREILNMPDEAFVELLNDGVFA